MTDLYLANKVRNRTSVSLGKFENKCTFSTYIIIYEEHYRKTVARDAVFLENIVFSFCYRRILKKSNILRCMSKSMAVLVFVCLCV